MAARVPRGRSRAGSPAPARPGRRRVRPTAGRGRSTRRSDRRPPPGRPRSEPALRSSRPVAAWLRRSSLESREIEKLIDEPGEPPRLLADALTELLALRGAQARGADSGAGGDDRGQWRAQVVRDRPQQCGLRGVRLPQRLGLDDLGLKGLAVEAQRPGAPRARAPRARAAASESSRRSMPEPLVWPRGPRRCARRQRKASSVPVDRAQLDRRRGQLKRLERGDDVVEPRAPRRSVLAEQQPGEVRGQVGLLAATLRLIGSRASQVGHGRGQDRGGQEDAASAT